MKNKALIFLVCVCLLSIMTLSGCTGSSKDNSTTNTDEGAESGNENKITVVATIFPQYDFVREIGGDGVNLQMLIPPGSEAHSFEPTPADIKTINDCDLFIYVGGESDAWIDDMLDSLEKDNVKTVKLMDLVDTVDEEIVEGMEGEEHEHDDGAAAANEHEVDEHVWTSPKNAMTIVEKLSQKLIDIDGANAERYKENTDKYISRLAELDKSYEHTIDSAARKTVVFGDRFPFRYMADDYGLEYYAAFSGCSTETEASAATISFLIDKVKDENIPVVFQIEFSNGNIARTICEETGAKSLLLHSCHNISKDDMENGETYISLMERNLKNLKEALN